MVIFSVVFALGLYVYSVSVATPMYKSTGQLHVTNTNVAVEDTTKITASDLSSSESLCNTLIELMQNDTFLEKVKNMGNFGLSPSTMRGMLVFDQPDETTLINVRVNSSSSKLAHEVASEILRHAPKYLENAVTGTTVKVVQEPKFETSPYSPNVWRNVFIGFVIGLVFGIACALCIELLNTKIEDGDTLEEIYGYPVLGEIPNLKGGRGSGVY